VNLPYKIDFPIKREELINYQHKVLSIGSCFSDNIGQKLKDNLFTCLINPFGVVYNPLSIANSLRRIINGSLMKKNDLSFFNGLYHTWEHHGSLSNSSSDMALFEMNRRISESREILRTPNAHLIVTFGSSLAFYHKDQPDLVVANCHKYPSEFFLRKKIALPELQSTWQNIIDDLLRLNPSLKVHLTVSPIRHKRDGLVLNQQSKSRLFELVALLTEQFESCTYFPSFEIMNDELRDYRFYQEDMIHPNQMAIDYIWERFAQARMDDTTIGMIDQWTKIAKRLNHRPLHPNSLNGAGNDQKFRNQVADFEHKYGLKIKSDKD